MQGFRTPHGVSQVSGRVFLTQTFVLWETCLKKINVKDPISMNQHKFVCKLTA